MTKHPPSPLDEDGEPLDTALRRLAMKGGSRRSSFTIRVPLAIAKKLRSLEVGDAKLGEDVDSLDGATGKVNPES